MNQSALAKKGYTLKQKLGTKKEQAENLVLGSDSTLLCSREQKHNLEGLFAQDPFLRCVEDGY